MGCSKCGNFPAGAVSPATTSPASPMTTCSATSPVFSTRDQNQFFCAQPVLTIGFPTCPTVCPGANTVVLANGAVVDLKVLGEIIGKFCPSFACPDMTAQAM
jgi:hypothetical protein